MTGGDILVECLKAQEVKAIFGMPGNQNVSIYDALYRRGEGIKHLVVRHEQSATFMADGYARVTGDVGVALTVPGPGASNASTGIGEAYTDCIPVLLITGQSDSRLANKDNSKLFHGLDQRKFFEPITKWFGRPNTVDEIPQVIEMAFTMLRTERPGPVVIEIPNDVVTAEVVDGLCTVLKIPPKVSVPKKKGKSDDIKKAIEILRSSQLPIIFAGGGVISSDASNELTALAECLGIPVITTRLGKGAIAEDNPLALSNIHGLAARRALGSADAMLAIGCRFTQIDTGGWSIQMPQPLIQIDADESELGKEYPIATGIAGDIKTVLSQLLKELKNSDTLKKNAWEPILQKIKDEIHQQPKLPILSELRKVLDRDTIVAVDVTSLGYRAFAEFEVYHPRSFLYPCIYVALGYAFPAALGAKVAYPDRQVVSVSGDGGFMMGSFELATAIKYGLNVVAIVVNDDAFGAIRGQQGKAYDGRYIATDLCNPDFVKFAESFGAIGFRVDNLDDFSSIIAEALRAKQPAVIEIPMTNKELIKWVPWLYPTPTR
ncbi:thiamine pyrophosphate-binding protein [Candidatus Poribacteria bacterium]|nr:thiamine pyrophosphate-binding protein [Candidatus Poribacteria bacterium]